MFFSFARWTLVQLYNINLSLEHLFIKLGHKRLSPFEIKKITKLKWEGFTNRQIQSRLGYSLSTVSKYTRNNGLNSYYRVNPGFTRRSPVDDKLVDIRRRISKQESDPSYLDEVKESWVDGNGHMSEEEYDEMKMMHTIETLKNNNKMKELENRIKELEETVNHLTKKLQELGYT